MAERPRLRALADRLGILGVYEDLLGVERVTSDATRESLLAARGFDASGEESAERELAGLEAAGRERLLAPVRVVRAGRARRLRVAPRLPRLGTRGAWRLELRLEDGRAVAAEGARAARALALDLALPPPPGYHRLRLAIEDASGDREAEQLLVVAPSTCLPPRRTLGRRLAFGLTANLYTLRSATNWGVGDLRDLAGLARWSADRGAAFVGLNPLHALRNRGWEISPYGPVTRLYRNPLYLHVEDVPELAESAEARERLAEPGFRMARERLRAARHVRYEDVTDLQRPVLEALHRTFAARHRGMGTPRGRAYAAYLEHESGPLLDFATFCALEERLPEGRDGGAGWRGWPEPLRDPRSAAVAAFRAANEERIDLHRWIQFELDRQLAAAAAAGRAAGLDLGLYQDLALGTSAGGSDPWGFPGLFVEGASVGAPPDDFSPEGQDWGLPPVDPLRLFSQGYAYWIRILRAAFAHAGALRIDHVMGLFRQFWIPAGRPGSEGAYVAYPAGDLVGILALESRRHGAIVIGEDLGTLPPGLRPELARRNILSSRVLYFERTEGAGFRASASYPPRALVTATTHDLPPLAGYWEGKDLLLRREAGHIPDEDALARALVERGRDRAALLARLREEGFLAEDEGSSGALPAARLCAAVTGFLCRTPSDLVGLALDDLTGETDPVNLPGVTPDRYPSWSRRMRVPLEDLATDEGVAAALAQTGGRAVRRPRRAPREPA